MRKLIGIKDFEEMIGKKVYRERNTCKCHSCEDTYLNGVVVSGKAHADYLAMIASDIHIVYWDEPLKKQP